MAAQDLQSKLNRSIRALLIAEGAGSTEDTFTEISSATRQLPNTTIDSGSASEHVMFTGNWRFQNVTLTMRDNAAVQPDDEINSPWVVAVERYNRIRVALSRIATSGSFAFLPGELTTAGRALAVSDGSESGDIIAADNADMADLTVMWWNITGLSSPRFNSEADCFESELQFDCIACNGNVS